MAELKNFVKLNFLDLGKDYDSVVLNGVQYDRAKAKQFILPIEGTTYYDDTDGVLRTDYAWYQDKHWHHGRERLDRDAIKKKMTVTQADIDSAPDWVKAIKPVGVKYATN